MSPDPPRLVVSVHDVSPASAPESRRWVRDLDEREVPASLLVVPGPWRGGALATDPRFADWLGACTARGHELCLHGWEHSAPAGAPLRRAIVGQLVARGCAEFWCLTEDQAADRAQRGLDALAGFGLHATGFTPPGWLVSRAALGGLRRVGLHYVATHGYVTDLRSGRRVLAPAICHRPGARGERVGAALMARGPGLFLRPGRTLRMALHPDDLMRPGLREAALRGIDAALDAGALASTYRSVVDAAAADAGCRGRPLPAQAQLERPGLEPLPWSDGLR